MWQFSIKISDGKKWSDLKWAKDITIESINTKKKTAEPFAEVIEAILLADDTMFSVNSKLVAHYFAPESYPGAIVTATIKWFKNGKEMSALKDSPFVDSKHTKAGDEWQFSVELSDGKSWTKPVKSQKVVINSVKHTKKLESVFVQEAIVISEDPDFNTNFKLQAMYFAHEPKPGAIVSAEIKWFRNGKEVPSLKDKPEISAKTTKPGEDWYYTVRVSDGKKWSETIKSNLIMITTPEMIKKLSTMFVEEVAIVPEDGKLMLYYFAHEPKPGAIVGVEVNWFQNGKLVPSLKDSPFVDSKYTKTGDIWKATVKLSDGNKWTKEVSSFDLIISA